MATDLELTKSFNEKVFERIRESIGDLMSDDDLKLLVNAAMQKAFFTDQYEPARYHGGSTTRTGPPLIVQEIKKLLEEQVKKSVDVWLVEHSDECKRLIDDAIAGGVFKMVMTHIENKFHGPMQNLRNELVTKGVIQQY
jgi:hypothetical protein